VWGSWHGSAHGNFGELLYGHSRLNITAFVTSSNYGKQQLLNEEALVSLLTFCSLLLGL
jgi:hypothetical protein